MCEAGCVLEALEHALNVQGMTVPLDLGAKGKCQIGGNVSTNAGGLRLLKHGSLHGSVLGLEVVTADGTVLDLLRTLRKDNTGYDLKQLFIGAEGTLGVITKIALVAPPRPIATNVAFAAAPSFDAAVAAMRLAKQSLGGALSAFEFLDRASLELVLRELTGTKDPLPHAKSPFYVVVEVAETEAGGGHTKNEQKNQPELLVLGKKTKQKRAALAKARRRLAAFANDAKRRGFVTAFVVGANAKHASALWNLRERISLALKRAGATYKYDLSLPTETMYDVVEALRARVLRAKRKEESDEKKTDSSAFFDYDTVSVMGYGHLGDGNLHLNVSSPGGYHAALLSLVEPFVYEWTAAAKGSVSAEHGVGAMKRDQLEYSKPSEAIEIMRGVKAMLDPKGILNPYKVLPARNTTPDHQPRARL